MRRSQGGPYPDDWNEIARAVKDEAGWRCVRCKHPHEPETGHTLTVHHADMDPSNSAWWNLWPLCQRCHLSVQARVDLDRPWVMVPHSEWARVYIAGYYAWRYRDELLSRAEVEARLDELLLIERQVYGLEPVS